MRPCWHAQVTYLLALVFAACSFPDVNVVDDPECLDDSGCDGGLRCSSEATCVPCVEDNHCPVGMVCAPDRICVGCVDSVDCEAPEALCDPEASLCVECLDQDDCADSNDVCADGTCAPEHCINGVQDADEIAEDCGGQDCAGCELETACTSPDDCKSGVCADEQCSLPCTITANCEDLKGTYCDGQACRLRKDSGSACTTPDECKTSICVDDVCCGTACDMPCRACNIGASTGTCTIVAEGTDDDACGIGGCCDASGECTLEPLVCGI